MKSYLYTFLALFSLSACGIMRPAPEYECKLNDSTGAKCASVDDSYKAARNMNKGSHLKVQSVFDARVQSNSQTNTDEPPIVGVASNMPEPGQNGMPVFQQPKVMRAWVAPYVDADGNLRTGEYVYFSTPGQWNYGSTTRAGSAGAAMFEPGKPGKAVNNILPQSKTSNTVPPPRPAEQSGKQTAPAEQNIVTQPYQRLSQ